MHHGQRPPQPPWQYAPPHHAARPQGYVDPRYVGPRWAMPGPPRPLPRPPPAQKSKLAVGCLAILGLVFVGPLLAGAVVLGIVAATRGDDDEVVDLPSDPQGHLPAVTPLGGIPDSTAQAAYTSGTCGDYSKGSERDRTTYFATRDDGSAKRLRGRVAMIHVRIHSSTLRWTKSGELTLTRAILMSQEYVTDTAKKRGITDLRFDVIPWDLATTYQLPAISPNGADLLTVETMQLVRSGAREAVEAAVGTRLEKVVAEIKADGYDQVGFIVHFPLKSQVRDFAFSSFKGDKQDAETAFLFSPTSGDPFGHYAVTVVHEGMHLFGADDLYRLTALDPGDKHDLMGEYCTGFKPAIVGDATAYAIGWRDTPPKRGYTFTDR